jgi:hypothetical protein
VDQLELKRQQFRQDGYCVLEGVHDSTELMDWQAAYDELCAREGELVWLGNALEFNPDLFWPAATKARILDLLESLMGPFLQLDGLAINALPSVPAEDALKRVNSWHRDRYAIIPETHDYVRPLACNTIFYLQDLEPTYGPLRVVPGSHRQPITVAPGERLKPREDEVLLHPRAGDVVVTHFQLLHSGSPNWSGKSRYFMAASYNSSWMKHRDDYGGSKVSALKARLKRERDRRGLRLLGEDPLMWERVNPYWFTGTEQQRWERWMAEDRAFARGEELPQAS